MAANVRPITRIKPQNKSRMIIFLKNSNYCFFTSSIWVKVNVAVSHAHTAESRYAVALVEICKIISSYVHIRTGCVLCPLGVKSRFMTAGSSLF